MYFLCFLLNALAVSQLLPVSLVCSVTVVVRFKNLVLSSLNNVVHGTADTPENRRSKAEV